jgi:NADH-quinone oxidoreductase subunit G
MTVAIIYIENKPYEANPKQNLLHACLSLGLDLPYFCWHPALGSVGACRQCAVKQFKNEEDTTGRLVMACMTPAADGTRISLNDHEAYAFRAGVIEGLMLNHPHDCPVCDEGGECHLQDMTVMTGHRKRRYHFSKRTFKNQYLGPFVSHEMNRCIQCHRCVRFYREYAGGHDLNAFRLRDTMFFGRAEDGVLQSEFAGNLVEICPTGVFTDATLKHHYTRKWDLQMAPSVCVHCGVGCNISAGERYGGLRRIINRYNAEVNGYFLCDRGRFGYEFVNGKERVREPLLEGKPVSKELALARVASILKEPRVIGIGSPRASLESNYALRKLIGPDHFYAGFSDQEQQLVSVALQALRSGPARSASMHDVESSDAAFVLGEDVTNTAPVMALHLRQSVRHSPRKISRGMGIADWLDHAVREAVQDRKGPLFIATPYATKLDDVATKTLRAAPDDLARLGFAVAHEIDPNAPAVVSLDENMHALAVQIATALSAAESPVVVSGIGVRSQAVIEAAAQIGWALHRTGRTAAKLAYAMPECNTFGAALFQARPLAEAFELAKTGAVDAAIVLENDLFRRAPSRQVKEFLEEVKHLVVLDALANETSRNAEVVLPAGTFAESDGTLVSSEGRAQRFFEVFVPPGSIQMSWRWLRDVAPESLCYPVLDDLIAAMAADLPDFERVPGAAPPRGAVNKIAREPNRYSGRTSMLANISVHEPKPPADPDSALSFSMESGPKAPPPPLIPFFWSPGWNSIQATNKYQQEVGGALRGGDPGVRLVEPVPQAIPGYFESIPSAFRQEPSSWLICLAHHIFGSEELSRHAPGVLELSPPLYLAINPQDAELAGIAAGDQVNLTLDSEILALTATLKSDVPRGVACVPAGLPQTEGLTLPARGQFATADSRMLAGGAR